MGKNRQTRINGWRGIREREDDELIYVPDQSFLDYDESFWIEHVNYDDDYLGLAEHVESSLHRYLEVLENDQREGVKARERLKAFEEICQEINDKLETGDRKIIPNVEFSPHANHREKDQYRQTRPFQFWHRDEFTVADIYWSLSSFLTGPYVRRLGRCKYKKCRGLFIASDDRRYEFCPRTNHQSLYWKERRAEMEYHRRDMAERRDPGSPKFDPKYIR